MEELLKLPEVARRLGISEPTARRYVKRGKLPSVFVGGSYRVTEADIERFLERARVKPGEDVPLGAAPPSPEPSERDALPEAWRLRLLRTVEVSARAITDLFAPKVEEGEFDAGEYTTAGNAYLQLSADFEAAMSNEFVRDEAEASEEERAAINRAWDATKRLQDTVQRAYEVLVVRSEEAAAAEVPDLDELEARRRRKAS